MANILDNKEQLQTLLSTIARKGVNGIVTSLNNKSGDITTEVTDLDVTIDTWTFELDNGNSVDKMMVLYSPKLINFTINGTSYQAEEGMTWAKWCDSEYNTYGCFIENRRVYYERHNYIYSSTDNGNIDENSGNVIKQGFTYEVQSEELEERG